MIKHKKRFHKWCKCNNIAKWYYMPFTDRPTERFFCNEHVPRGCMCNSCHIEEDGLPKDDNIIWLNEEHTLYEYLDEKGRRSPCCEFDYDENGQEYIERDKFIKKNDMLEIWNKLYVYVPKSPSYPSLIKYIEDIEKSDKEEILYNPFMQTIRNLWTPYWRYLMFGKGNNQVHFYNSFREQCNLKSYMKYLDD